LEVFNGSLVLVKIVVALSSVHQVLSVLLVHIDCLVVVAKSLVILLECMVALTKAVWNTSVSLVFWYILVYFTLSEVFD
jgi:hypothetical protein